MDICLLLGTNTIGELPKHVHNWKGRVFIDPGSTYTTALFGLDDCSDLIAQNKGIQYTGNNQMHNNLPPYYACYVWRRTE